MAQTQENRVYLFRLQILIIDGGLLVLRNIIDQTLTTQGVTLSACLNQERSTITRLKSRGIITQEQYDILFPIGGHVPTTSEMDLTLIIFLLRSLRCFGLNKKFDWKAKPISTDVSIEADICRLKAHRNEISHKVQTTDIQANDFVTLWNDIEQILVRLSSPALNIQQTFADYKTCPLDPKEEKRVQEEIKKWKDCEADVDRLKEEMTDVKVRVTEVEKNQEEIKRRLDEDKNNECVSSMLTEEDKYHKRKKEYNILLDICDIMSGTIIKDQSAKPGADGTIFLDFGITWLEFTTNMVYLGHMEDINYTWNIKNTSA